jgi:hypothetical protein
VITNTAIINDLHRPFHDPHALNTTLNIIEDVGVDRIILNGDIMDMYNVNSHGPTHPLVGSLLLDEIDDTRMWLEALRARFPKVEIVFLFGNHEDRFDRFMVQYAKALFNLVSLPKLLRLDELGIKWQPYNYRYQLEKTNVYVQHSPPSYGKNGAMTSLERDVDQTSIYGCSHRQQHVCKTSKSGVVYECFYNGWLGSTSLTEAHSKVFSYVKGHQNWQQCFILATVEDGKKAFVEQISIRNGEALYDGHIYG